MRKDTAVRFELETYRYAMPGEEHVDQEELLVFDRDTKKGVTVKAAIEQLARKHPWIDMNLVGIYGHSGGGFASTHAILAFPDFYKVAVSSAGEELLCQYRHEAVMGRTLRGGFVLSPVTAAQLPTRVLSWSGSINWSEGPAPLAEAGHGVLVEKVTSSTVSSEPSMGRSRRMVPPSAPSRLV